MNTSSHRGRNDLTGSIKLLSWIQTEHLCVTRDIFSHSSGSSSRRFLGLIPVRVSVCRASNRIWNKSASRSPPSTSASPTPCGIPPPLRWCRSRTPSRSSTPSGTVSTACTTNAKGRRGHGTIGGGASPQCSQSSACDDDMQGCQHVKGQSGVEHGSSIPFEFSV